MVDYYSLLLNQGLYALVVFDVFVVIVVISYIARCCCCCNSRPKGKPKTRADEVPRSPRPGRGLVEVEITKVDAGPMPPAASMRDQLLRPHVGAPMGALSVTTKGTTDRMPLGGPGMAHGCPPSQYSNLLRLGNSSMKPGGGEGFLHSQQFASLQAAPPSMTAGRDACRFRTSYDMYAAEANNVLMAD